MRWPSESHCSRSRSLQPWLQNGLCASATGLPQPGQPLLVMVHGFMDVGASFQFVVDAMAAAGDGARCVVAPDWRGFGRSEAPGATDAYWFADYLGDLDALLDALSPDAPVDLLGHSMGGNVAMAYAGVRPGRVRRLVNLEGFGLPHLPAVLSARVGNPPDLLEAAVRSNVQRTVRRLRAASEPTLLAPQQKGQVKVVGAYYTLENGHVDFFDV